MQVSNQASFNAFKRAPLQFGLATKEAPSASPGDELLPNSDFWNKPAPVDQAILKSPAIKELGDNFSKLKVYSPLKAYYEFAATKTPFTPIITRDHLNMPGQKLLDEWAWRINFYTPYNVGLLKQKRVYQPIASVVMKSDRHSWKPVKLDFDIPTYQYIGGGKPNEKTVVHIDPTMARLYLASLCNVKIDTLEQIAPSLQTDGDKKAVEVPKVMVSPTDNKQAVITEYIAGHPMIQVSSDDWSTPAPIDRLILENQPLNQLLNDYINEDTPEQPLEIAGSKIDPFLMEFDRGKGLMTFYTAYSRLANTGSDKPIAALKLKHLPFSQKWEATDLIFEIPGKTKINPLMARAYLATLCHIPISSDENQILPDSHQKLEAVQWEPLPPPTNPKALETYKPPGPYTPTAMTLDRHTRRHTRRSEERND